MTGAPGWGALLRKVSRRAADPSYAREAKAHLTIADLAFPRTVLFTGKGTADALPRMFAYETATANVGPWMDTPATDCVGCHVAVSRDGTRVVAGGRINGVGGSFILDAAAKSIMSPPRPEIGFFQAAAFDPTGALVTTDGSVMTVRDGTNAQPLATLTTDIPATQPSVAHDGQALAYVGGALDPVTTQPAPTEHVYRCFSKPSGQVRLTGVRVDPSHGGAPRL